MHHYDAVQLGRDLQSGHWSEPYLCEIAGAVGQVSTASPGFLGVLQDKSCASCSVVFTQQTADGWQQMADSRRRRCGFSDGCSQYNENTQCHFKSAVAKSCSSALVRHIYVFPSAVCASSGYDLVAQHTQADIAAIKTMLRDSLQHPGS